MGRAWRLGAAPFLLGLPGMTAPPPTLPAGIWGGEQVTLEVGADKAILRLGCAEGAFAAPIRLDGQGRFTTPGTYSAFSGGPSTASDEVTKAQYEGVLDGDRLTLTLKHGASTERYQLTHGLHSKVIRCL